MFSSLPAMADDIDLFLGTSGGAATAPQVMIMLDNSTNDLFTAKLAAISTVLNNIVSTAPMNIGLALWSPGSTPKGAYIRFAPRDMSVAANRTALQNILTLLNTKNEYNGSKNEPEAFYEIFKYFSSLAPYTGVSNTAINPNVDKIGNIGSYVGATASGQGLTSGFAFQLGDALYNSTATSCGRNYIIYIAANNGFTPSDVAGQQTHEGLSAGASLPPASDAAYWGDEWTHYLYGHKNPQVVTFVLDAASPGNSDAGYTAILQAEAKQGGGNWQYVSSQSAIVTALLKIFVEIQAVNSTFASASLPVNATNRAQDKNQVFIPLFRPDPNAAPRWMGNLKQYQLITSGNSVVLGDSATPPIPALNPLTGIPTDCATSFWTTDSGSYWQNVVETPSPAGKCGSTSFNTFSDAPDGPIVEKGGVAEVIRKGNNPPTTNTTPTNAVNRTVYTLSGTSLTAFSTTSSGLSASLVNFVLGQDVNAEYTGRTAPSALTRPSLHGDTIHSRPLPIDYSGTTGVTVYYGANDGTLRAVDAAAGQERWAFIAPEFFSKFQRLNDNSPSISYPGMPAGVTPTPLAKDYFFDGTTGIYQNADNSKVWIYPSMRRGGRMIYSLDVTNPATPIFKWKAGCPNLTNDTGCATGLIGIGQTWSQANIAASVLGYTGPVVIMGGGYDGCEDANTATPTCTSPKGAGVFVFDAATGALIKSFSTTRSVPADIALIAVATTGVVDHAYAADTGGNIYRIDFASTVSAWTINRVAYTNGSGRKFFYPPALLAAPGGQVYLAIGSGDREHPLQSQYPYSGVTNRFYVYRDNLSATTATNLDDTTVMSDFTTDTTCSTAGILPTSINKGYFVNLTNNGAGEQVVTSAVIAAGLVTFSTNRPIPAAVGTCSTTLGEARGYFLNLLSGSGAIGVTGACGGIRSSIFVGGGLPPSPVFATVPINGQPQTVLIGAVQRSGAASSSIAPQIVNPTITPARSTIYWKSSGEN
jgi:type IV pilus assembly protein PilY1